MVKVDPKYVDMLNKAYEKYSKLEVVYSNSTVQHFNKSNEFSTKLSEEESKSSSISCSEENGTKIKNKILSNEKICKDKKIRKNQANYGHKRYSEKENEFLLKYSEKNKDFDQNKSAKVKELVKLMEGRTFKSIMHQIKVLRSGPITPAQKRMKFSLTEDKLIIDEALKHLKLCKSLREAKIQNVLEFSKSFKRIHSNINERWESTIKCWLLQFYNKTLNQEIRPMLVDLIHKNYDSVVAINWEFVLSHKEFSGYNVSGLKKIFVATVDKVAKSKSKPSYELSISEIANFTEDDFSNNKMKAQPVLDKRKMDCIEYFEMQTSELNISFSKT